MVTVNAQDLVLVELAASGDLPDRTAKGIVLAALGGDAVKVAVCEESGVHVLASVTYSADGTDEKPNWRHVE